MAALLPYSVECFLTVSGKHIWSGTWEASCPADAIAQACLAPEDRKAFFDLWDEASSPLTVQHPAEDMDAFSIRAEAIP